MSRNWWQDALECQCICILIVTPHNSEVSNFLLQNTCIIFFINTHIAHNNLTSDLITKSLHWLNITSQKWIFEQIYIYLEIEVTLDNGSSSCQRSPNKFKDYIWMVSKCSLLWMECWMCISEVWLKTAMLFFRLILATFYSKPTEFDTCMPFSSQWKAVTHGHDPLSKAASIIAELKHNLVLGCCLEE